MDKITIKHLEKPNIPNSPHTHQDTTAVPMHIPDCHPTVLIVPHHNKLLHLDNLPVLCVDLQHCHHPVHILEGVQDRRLR